MPGYTKHQDRKKIEVIETRNATLCKIDEGILQVLAFKKNNYTLDDARELMRASIKLSRGEKIPILFTLANVSKIDREARALMQGDKACRITKAVALLIRSDVMRFIMQFYMRTFNAPYPVRFFGSEVEAINWLKAFIQ